MKIPYVFRVCTKCGEPKVANTKYFRKQSKGRYGLTARCKECLKKEDEEYRKTPQGKKSRKETNKKYQQSDKFKETRKKYYESDKGKETRKKYLQSDKYKEYLKEYQKSDKGKVSAFNNGCRRRIKEQSQGSGITKEQWRECMNYFDWKCAYSGKPLNENNRSLDHVVPLNKGGANEIWNMVPMARNYNSSKKDKSMEEWYKEQEFYSEERLQKIYEWLEYAYKKWGEYYEKDNNWNSSRVANNNRLYLQLPS